MFVNIMLGLVVALIVGIIVLVILMVAKPDIFSKNKNASGKVITAEDSASQDEQTEVTGDTKDFIPVVEFDGFSMDLGNHNYRAIVEVSSVNYALMSQMEQEMIEIGYQSFLNSLRFPIEIYVQTREFDKDFMVDNLKTEIKRTKRRFPSIENYAKLYTEQMQQVTDYTKNSKVKKKFIIVPYDNTELSDVSALTNAEIKQFALEQLYNRCQIVVGGMAAIGLSAQILDKAGIMECLYSYYHRIAYRIGGDIAGGEFTSLVVQAENEKYRDKRVCLDEILNSAENRIKTELVTADSSEQELAFYNYIYSMLEFFKQNDRSGFIGDLMDEDKMKDSGNYDSYKDFVENDPEAVLYSNYEQAASTEVTPHYYYEEGGQ